MSSTVEAAVEIRPFHVEVPEEELAELRRILVPRVPQLDVIGLDDVEPYDEVPESGATFEGNSILRGGS